MKQGFRRDIEGLRAVAVLPILLFHLNPMLCPGGFIGVDIFFVISGFLITRMILAEGDAFRFKTFYVRRFFRLFPALLVTLLGALIAGWFVLVPADYASLARSAIASMFGVSNFYFLSAVNYFNASSLSHPLLHTWSLAAEEQFYLVWPILLVLARRWGMPFWLFASGMATLSFLALCGFQGTKPDAVFYMMPFRIVQFAIGAGLNAFSAKSSEDGPPGGFAAGLLGVVLLLASFAGFDGQTPWPSTWTLVPTAATALLIFAGVGGFWNRMLGLDVLRFLGRISYSVYLVHWPLISLYRARMLVEPEPVELLALGLASLAIGAVLHAGVEVPFRLRPASGGPPGRPSSGPSSRPSSRNALGRWLQVPPMPRRPALASLLLLCVAFLGGALAILLKDGFSSRVERGRSQFLDKGLTFAGDICNSKRARCVFGDRHASKVVYVIGDSHALNLIFGLDQLFREAGIKGIAFYDHGCLFLFETKRFLKGRGDEKCRQNIEDAYGHLIKNRRPVIIAGNYAGYRHAIGLADASQALRHEEGEYYAWLDQQFRKSLARLDAANRQIVIVKQTYSTGVNLAKCLALPGTALAAKTTGETCVPLTLAEVQRNFKDADRLIDNVASAFPPSITIDPKLLFCPGEPCTTSGEDGLFFRDPDHATNAGSLFLIGRAKDILLPRLNRP